MIAELLKEFENQYGHPPQRIFFCPGRVNLIGEHIDYNGGRVMPCALSLGTWLAISKNTEKILRFHSLNFPGSAVLHLQTSYSKSGDAWYNYPLGVISHFTENELSVSGMNMLFAGNLPVGAGLSSSASIEVLMAYAISEIFGHHLPGKEIALLSKKAENRFIGVNCGIMDQFAVAHGKKKHAILLNCDTLEYEYIPMEPGNYALVIINTHKPRKLVDSKYNERFTECGRALKALKKELPVRHLCDISPEQFEKNRHLLTDSVLEKRAMHVISENARVQDAAESLQKNDLVSFGRLMYASHQSLKENYEVTGKELDTIVDFCKTFDGCMGSRMTGAGFGGCAIALVEVEKLDFFTEEIIPFYETTIGYKPSVLISEAGEGVREIIL